MKNIHDYLGLYFRLLRKQAGLSLENISYGLSVSTSLLSDIENQRRKMKPCSWLYKSTHFGRQVD